jgi:hypothetical protein
MTLEQLCIFIAVADRLHITRACWLNGSVSEIVARHSAAPTLFITPGATGFVSQINGEVKLRRALVPIDFSPRADMKFI